MSLIKTIWHCLFYFLGRHRICSVQINDGPKRYFCECGYLNNGMNYNEFMHDRWSK